MRFFSQISTSDSLCFQSECLSESNWLSSNSFFLCLEKFLQQKRNIVAGLLGKRYIDTLALLEKKNQSNSWPVPCVKAKVFLTNEKKCFIKGALEIVDWCDCHSQHDYQTAVLSTHMCKKLQRNNANAYRCRADRNMNSKRQKPQKTALRDSALFSMKETTRLLLK